MSEQLTPPGIELYLSTEPSKLLIRDHAYLPFRSINPNLPDLGSTFFFSPSFTKFSAQLQHSGATAPLLLEFALALMFSCWLGY